VHADPKHEQNDPNLSQLGGQFGTGHKTWRKRSLCHARQKITDEWRQAQPADDVAADQSLDQANGDRRNQGNFMKLAPSSISSPCPRCAFFTKSHLRRFLFERQRPSGRMEAMSCYWLFLLMNIPCAPFKFQRIRAIYDLSTVRHTDPFEPFGLHAPPSSIYQSP
jgi:hypothetical protein